MIRPLASRINDARMSLAALPVEREPLRADFGLDAYRLRGECAGALDPPGRDVREQVLREAHDDALAFHCTEPCPHVAEREPIIAVFSTGWLGCESCWHDAVDTGRAESVLDQLAAPDSACSFCGREDELLLVQTRFGDAITYIAHPCPVCASWWPRQHADVTYIETGRPVSDPDAAA